MTNVRSLRMLLAFLFMAVATPAFGIEFAGGTGTVDDPYEIGTREQLISMGQDPNLLDKHFELTQDIDLDPNSPGGRVFTQAVIAADTDPANGDFQGMVFAGSFNGNGHTIKHLTIDGGDADFLGLFGRVGKKAEIRDLALEDIRVTSSGYCVAGLVGFGRGRISNCRVTGSISGGTGEWSAYLGLLAGRVGGHLNHCEVNGTIDASAGRSGYLGLLAGENSAAMSDCTADGTITGGDDCSTAGGLAGDNRGSIADCRATTNIVIGSKHGNSREYGGLVGSNAGVISRCYATGSILCGFFSSSVGGLAGYNSGVVLGCYATGSVSGQAANSRYGGLVGANSGYITCCYATGDVTGNSRVGGLVGGSDWGGSISQSYATGHVAGDQQSWSGVGGLAGGWGIKTDRCFWDVDTSGMTKSDGGTGLSTTQMQDAQTFLDAGWDYVREQANGTADMWSMPEGGGYPVLAAFSEGYRRHELEGSGTPDDPYRIATAEDLGAIRHHDVAACYRLTANIDLNDITWTTAVIPGFEGRFDGNNLTISNLTMKGRCSLGLFGVLETEAVVENLNIENARIVAEVSSEFGLMAVENLGRIANCRVTGRISFGDKDLTKFAGTNYGTIIDCDPVAYSGPYMVIVTDQQATRQFLKFKGINFDQVWTPDANDLNGLDSMLWEYLDSDLPIDAGGWVDQEYILANLRRYSREYSGFTRGKTKYIICSMHIFWEEFDSPSDSHFSIIFDGGSSVMRVIFDAETKAVVSIECNGVA